MTFSRLPGSRDVDHVRVCGKCVGLYLVSCGVLTISSLRCELEFESEDLCPEDLALSLFEWSWPSSLILPHLISSLVEGENVVRHKGDKPVTLSPRPELCPDVAHGDRWVRWVDFCTKK